ncbi:MAG: choice-of-anchor Q domain-containing protein, partial [Microcoleaceae cyanobacterium]
INNLLSSLNIENSQFINNSSLAGKDDGKGYGGAIYTDGASKNNDNIGGKIRIFNSRFDSNQGAGQGGALFLFGYPPDQIIIDRSQIINNRVIFNSKGDSLGAGVRAGNGNFTMTNTTVANNLSLSQGGGLWLGERGTSRIVNSTFSGNQAYQVELDSNDQPLRDSQGQYIPVLIDGKKQGLGGAIKLTENNTNIINTTVANNYAGFQGGAFWGGNDTVTTLTNSIFADNTAGNPWNVKLQSGVMYKDDGGNIQFPAKQTTDPSDVNLTASIRIVNPRLGELQQLNGVLVHPILPGSPAIDFATGAGVSARDQLQKVRLDGNNDNIITADSGAYEYMTDPLRGINQRGTANNDTSLQRTIGNDTLTGLAGNDILNGDLGSDRLVGNTGNDQLSGSFG